MHAASLLHGSMRRGQRTYRNTNAPGFRSLPPGDVKAVRTEGRTGEQFIPFRFFSSNAVNADRLPSKGMSCNTFRSVEMAYHAEDLSHPPAVPGLCSRMVALRIALA